MNDPDDPGAGGPGTHDPGGPATLRAGEYVLGLLSAAEAASLERDAGTDPTLAAEVAFWERSLAPLLAGVPAVPPPPSLWRRLEASLDPVPPAAPPRPGRRWWRSLLAWRLATAACAAAAVLALVLRPDPPVPVAALEPTAGPGPTIVALRFPDGRLLLRPVSALAPPPGRALELWSLPDGAVHPASLGLLGPQGATVRAPRGPGRLLVSVEPAGGAPAGTPTGAVAWAGTLGGEAPVGRAGP